MTKKEPNLLGLAPLNATTTGVVICGAVTGVNRPPTEAEQRISQESQKHVQIIQNQRAKAEVAAHEISQMHQQSAQEFLEMAMHLTAIKALARGNDYQALVEEFNQRTAQLAAQHLFGVAEVTARNIGIETARPLYPEEKPIVVKVVEKEKRGLLQRLIGG